MSQEATRTGVGITLDNHMKSRTTLWTGIACVRDGRTPEGGRILNPTSLGAYVRVVGAAESPQDFEFAVMETLQSLGLHVDWVDEVETIPVSFEPSEPKTRLAEMAIEAMHTHAIILGTFHGFCGE